jgi:hypothetical protein
MPIWVFGLFFLLVIFGLQQTRSCNISAALAYFLPFGMIALSLSGINSSFGIRLLKTLKSLAQQLVFGRTPNTSYQNAPVNS